MSAVHTEAEYSHLQNAVNMLHITDSMHILSLYSHSKATNKVVNLSLQKLTLSWIKTL
jgi:hypothetical protein